MALRYKAAAAARLWTLGKVDGDSGDAPDTWSRTRELADEADTYLDDDRQDEALYRRALANLLALQLFQESDEQQRLTNKIRTPVGAQAHRRRRCDALNRSPSPTTTPVRPGGGARVRVVAGDRYRRHRNAENHARLARHRRRLYGWDARRG